MVYDASGHEVSAADGERRMHAMLDQAVYGQDRYEFRISQLKKLFSMISKETSLKFIRSYIGALQGLFAARSSSDVGQLVLLRDLFLTLRRGKPLVEYEEQFDAWIGVVNKGLASFALKDGDVIRIRSTQFNEFLYALASKRVQKGISSLFLTSAQKMDAQIGCSLFRVKKNSGIGRVVHYGDSVSFEPLYVQVNNFIYASPAHSGIALISSVRRGKLFNGVGINWGSISQGDEHHFVLRRSSDMRRNEHFFENGVPVLAGEGTVIVHDKTGRAFACGAGASERFVKSCLATKKIGTPKVSYRKNKPLELLNRQLVFTLNPVTSEELKNIRHAQFDYLLRRAREHDVMTDRVAAYEASLQLLAHDMPQTKQDMLAHDLQTIFYERPADVEVLRSMKSLFVQAASHDSFEPRRIEFEHYVGQINKDLVPLGLRYGDVICLRSRHQGNRLLWTHGDSRYQSGGHFEVVAGPNDNSCVHDGPQLFKVLSADGKSGTVQYGDGVELAALYAGAGVVNGSLGRGQKLWVNPNSYCGKNFYEILVGPNSCNQAQNGQEVFFFRPHDTTGASVASRVNPVLPDDVVELWSRQFDRKVWVNKSSLSAGNSHELLVGPNSDNYHGVNRTENGQQLFSVERVDPSQLTAIADADFFSRLGRVSHELPFEKRTHIMQDLYVYAAQNAYVSTDAKQAFVEELKDLFSRRQGVDEMQLSRFAGFLTASNTDFFEPAQRKAITAWSEALAYEKTERAIDTGLMFAARQSSHRELIESYRKVIPLMDSKYASRRSRGFLDKLHTLSLQVKDMNADDLTSLKGLLSHALQVDYGVRGDESGMRKLAHLHDLARELSFKADLARASQAAGGEQIQAYKKLLPHAHEMTDRQRLELVRSLKNIFETKIHEIQEIKGVLEQANTRAFSKAKPESSPASEVY